MENIGAAVSVTLIGMGIIFFVLILLLFTIVVLNRLFPYVAPAPEPEPVMAGAPDEAEVVAVIQAALTHYLRKKPGKISVKPSQ